MTLSLTGRFYSHRLPHKKNLLVVKNFLLGGIHPGLCCRFAYLFGLFIAIRTVTPTRILVQARISPSLPVKRRYRAPDALSSSSLNRRSFPYHILTRSENRLHSLKQVLILIFFHITSRPRPCNPLVLCSIPFNPSSCTYHRAFSKDTHPHLHCHYYFILRALLSFLPSSDLFW